MSQDLFASGPEWLLDNQLLLIKDFLSSDEATQLQRMLTETMPWKQETLTIYGKEHPIPRLQAWMGDDNIQYRYSGKTFQAERWSGQLKTLADKLSTVAATRFNSVLLNLYRDGNDAMGWHSDDEPELGPAPVIASLSLGAERDFAVRRRGSSRQHAVISLPHGSLLIMQAGMQRQWQHSVPRRKAISDSRINLTFRQIFTDKTLPESET